MANNLVLIDRMALLSELQRVFNAPTSEVLVGVLDKVAAQVKAAGVAREDFSELKQITRDLVEAQRQSEVRLSRLETIVAELAEAQRRTEQAVKELAEAQRQSEARLSGVEKRLDKLTDKVARLDGRVLELTYREKAGAYFGPLLRRTRVVAPHTLEDVLEARLAPDEFRDVLLLDLLLTGRPRLRPESPDVWLAVEVSAVVDEGDVTRARRRATLLQRAGYRAIPAVAGEELTQGAEAQVKLDKVVVLQDGRYLLWEEALATWVA